VRARVCDPSHAILLCVGFKLGLGLGLGLLGLVRVVLLGLRLVGLG
jgi:hypothetical protein